MLTPRFDYDITVDYAYRLAFINAVRYGGCISRHLSESAFLCHAVEFLKKDDSERASRPPEGRYGMFHRRRNGRPLRRQTSRCRNRP